LYSAKTVPKECQPSSTDMGQLPHLRRFQIVKAPERSAVKRLRSLKKTIENALSGAQFLARLMLLRVAELYSLVAKAAKTERQKGEEHGENEEEGL